MEVDKKDDIPDSVVKDDQHTMSYYQALPYANLLDGEAETWLNEICTNLAMCVQARDFGPGAASWVKRLNSYINMKHSIPRETRAKLAELLFQMTFMPGLDTALMDAWAATCARLIRKSKYLGPEDLVLPWKPLYDAIDWYLFPNTRQKSLLADSKHLGSLIRLLEHAQRFFPASATQEILDELLPQFSTSEIRDALRVIGYLVLLLPVSIPRNSQTHAILDKDNNGIHPKEFLPTLFSLWSMITNSPTCDAQFVELLSRMAEQNISDEYTTEIGLFNRQQVKYIFTVGMRMMNLPVGSQENGGSRPGGTTGFGSNGQRTDLKAGNALALRHKPERFRSLARFIVYTIIPEGPKGESYVMKLLSEMIQATELYYHPSNHGTWTYSLTTFIQHLSVEFLKRWRSEEEKDCPTPQERRLTLELRKQFVLTLRPLTYLSMFGKDHFVIGATEATMKSLAWLEPGLIFPGLLERIYPSLETLTETHRTTSALGILADVALPLFSRDHYPAGGKHLMPLLHLATPGVDMNDPLKAITSLLFITSALSTVPIRDLTTNVGGGHSFSAGGGYSNNYTSDLRYDGMDMDSVNEENELPREEEDNLCKATTGEMEEWVAKFLRRVFTVFENLPQIHNQKKQNGSTETGLTSMLEYACDTVFGQLSDDLYDMALRMVMDFISEQVLPNAIHAAGLLCNSIASANPAKAAKKLIPLCINNISIELENGAGSTMTNSETSTPIQSDSTLHWYQCILYYVVNKLGPDLLNYKKDIVDILHEMVTKCKSRRGFIWSAELLKNCLGSLLRIYPKERRSLDPEHWNDEDFMNNSHMIWGKTGDPKNVNVDWHTPSQKEKEFAIELLETFLVPSMDHVRQKIETGDKGQPANAYEETNDFCRHLAVIYRGLRGCTSMCLDENTEKDAVVECADDEGSEAVQEPRRLVAGYAFTDSSDPLYIKAQKIRKNIGELIRDALEFFLVKREDDLESLKLVINMARTYMDDAGTAKQHVNATKGQYLYAKAVVKVPKATKQYPRGLLVRRAEIHHLQRLRYNAQSRTRDSVHDAILNNLLGLSLSSYAEIRKLSQHTLSAVAKNFIGSKTLILPPILDVLKSKLDNGDDKEQHANRIKGSLYLLRHRSILMPCLRDWRYVPNFVLSLCGAQHEDKPSIQELIRKVFVDYVTQFNTRSFGVIVPEDVDINAQAIYPNTTTSGTDTPGTIKIDLLKEKTQTRESKNLEAYQQLVQSLLEFVNDPKVHWRYCSMAANLLELFIRPDMQQNAGVAAFASECINSELPPMRRIGVGITTNMLYHIEQRTFAKGNRDTILSHQVKHPLEREFNVADKNPKYSEEKYLRIYDEPLTDENVQQWPLVDSERAGWYVWPEVYKGYLLPSSNVTLPEIDQGSLDAYQVFHKNFTSKEYWEKLLKYMSQEVSRAQEDMFNHANVCLYLSIFQMYQDEPVEVMKENFVSLCQSTDQKAHQRAAAELAAGLVNATSHWSKEKADTLWGWLIPLIETTFSNITPDTLIYWESFVRVCSHRRDPRRIRPLINMILKAKVDPTSDAAFAEARKLILAHILINSLGWRANPLVDSLLDEYMEHIDHPYKQVREVLGDNISSILQRQWAPYYPDIKTLLRINSESERGGVGNIPTQMDDRVAPHVEKLLVKLDKWQAEAKIATEVEDTKTYTNASKTTLCWLRQSLGRYRVVGTLPYIIPLWSRLFAMQEFHDDQDLQHMATHVLHMVAQYSYPPSVVTKMVNEFVDILAHSESWRIRTRALPLLQIFFFKYLFSMENDHVLQVMNSVSSMLLDTQIEVRQMAAVTLGGLVRCSQREAITTVQTQYSELLEIKLPKRRRDRETGKIIEVPGFADKLLKKHAGVLGLSCLVNAFPYEVPKWMPNVLCQLANCMSDPAEIQSTIRKTFSDFRRTHSDTWHEDMSKFTEDQLSILSDMLISPSYYA